MDDATLTRRLGAIIGRIPTFAWHPDGGAPSTSEIGVYYGKIPDRPDRAVGIRVYGDPDVPDLSVRRVQLRVRGSRRRPDGADVIADVLHAVLHERPRGDGISVIRRISFALLGADTSDREERSENYLITLDNLEASS